MRAGALLGWKVDVACPAGAAYEPMQEVLDECAEISAISKAEVRVTQDPLEAARDSDVVYTGTHVIASFGWLVVGGWLLLLGHRCWCYGCCCDRSNKRRERERERERKRKESIRKRAIVVYIML
jgi:Aspartate/ornithine carbamoyltransferase, Asp/Orn binding domain